jgi:hypothetical protein
MHFPAHRELSIPPLCQDSWES